MISKLFRICVQLLTKAWCALLEGANFLNLSNGIVTCTSHNEVQDCFLLLLRRAEGFSSLQQKPTLENDGSPIHEVGEVDGNGFRQPDSVDDGMGYFTCLLLDRLHFPTLNFDLHIEDKAWMEANKYVPGKEGWPAVFCNPPDDILLVLKAEPTTAFPCKVVNLDEKGGFVAASDQRFLPVASLLRNALVKYFELSWPGIEEWAMRKLLRTFHAIDERR